MGGKTAKRKVILGFVVGALALVFQGTLYNQSILRGNDFNWSKNLSLARYYS